MALKNNFLKLAQQALDTTASIKTIVNKSNEKEPGNTQAKADAVVKVEANNSKTTSVAATKVDGPREIDSLDGMNSWLSELQAGASESVQSALRAQMQVISFVQSSTLVDTTIDTLVLNLKKSLECEKSDEMREKIHERFSLMIQNYVFFLDARLQMQINANKEEASRLCSMAGEMLSQSVVDVAMLAVPEVGIAKGLSSVVVKNVFADENNQPKADFFTGILKLIVSDQKERIADFYKTVYKIITKLDKYSSLIGKSMLICGMIERYTPNLVDFEFPKEQQATHAKTFLDKVIDFKDSIVGKKEEEPKLLRPNKKLIALNEEIYTIEQEIIDVQAKLDELNKRIGNKLGFNKKERQALTAQIDDLRLKLREKEKAVREEKIFAKTNFEEQLLAIAKKFNEVL